MHKTKKIAFHKGFSFIELMLVIAVMGIMISIMFRYNRIRNESQVKAAQTEVVATMKQAQSYSLQGKSLLTGTPYKYVFKFSSNREYGIYWCGSDPCNPDTDVLVERYFLPGGVRLTSPGYSATRFEFDVPNGNYCNNPNNCDLSSDMIVLNLFAGGISKTIEVLKGGAIRERN